MNFLIVVIIPILISSAVLVPVQYEIKVILQEA